MQIILDLGSGFDDCNGNGFSDWYDIQIGVSQDANGDGIPDECSFVLTQPSGTFVSQRDSIPIEWVDGDPPSGFVSFFLSTDLSAAPWNQPGSTQIATLSASSAVNQFDHSASFIEPGTYSVWGRLDIPGEPPIYTRSPGNVTVTAVTENDEPVNELVRLSPADIPQLTFVQPPVLTSDKLMIVTHGWNGPTGPFANPDHSWIADIAEDVAVHLSDTDREGEWDVAYLDWTIVAYAWPVPSLPGPDMLMLTSIARGIGIGVAQQIIDAGGYTHVEVIAHSAGSWLADGIADRLFNDAPSVHTRLHLLDPAAFRRPIPTIGITLLFSYRSTLYLGDKATETLSYMDRRDENNLFGFGSVPFTNAINPNAVNVDVSCWEELFKTYNWPLGPKAPFDSDDWTDGHASPWAWFRESTRHAAAGQIFVDAPYGFNYSLAHADSVPVPPKSTSWVFPFSCSSPVARSESLSPVFVPYRTAIELSSATAGSGGTGSYTLGEDAYGQEFLSMHSGVDVQWASFAVPLAKRVDVFYIEQEFVSESADAEGYFSGFWNGAQILSSDERYQEYADGPGLMTVFPNTIDPESAIISFRLEANGGPESSARISNIRTGVLIQADINADGVLDKQDFCAWAANPTDLNGDGVIDEIDLQLLADAVGVSEIDSNGSGIPDICEPCPGDINGDGFVNLDDFIILAGNFGSGPGMTPQQGDLNGDGFVNLDDFIILAGNFGNDCN